MLGFRLAPKNFLKETGKAGNLSEIYGSNQKMPEFALIHPSGRQIGEWMKCKDYIQDAVWATITNNGYSIYGFSFKKGEDNINLNHLTLAVRWPGKKATYLAECLENVKSTVEDIEKKLRIPKFRRTRFARVRRGGAERSYFIVYGSKYWMRCVATVSFFTWLIRASLTNEGRKLKTLNPKNFPVGKDAYYMKSGRNFIDVLLSQGLSAFEPDWGNYKSVYNVHNNGFVKYSSHGEDMDDEDDVDYEDEWEFD